jgi:hypothetical protein
MAKKDNKWNNIKGWISEKFPKVKQVIGDTLPDKGVLGIIKNLVSKDEDASPEDKARALEMLHEYEITEMQEVTKRWALDSTSDSWLSKNVRPLTLVFMIVVMTVLVFFDSVDGGFEVKRHWVNLVESLLLTIIIAYFGSRGIEKFNKINNK